MKNKFTQNLISGTSLCVMKWLMAIAFPLLVMQTAYSQLNYVPIVCNDPYVQAQGQAGTVFLGLGDDPIFLNVPIGFTFTLYTTAYTTCSVGNNGFMVFPSGAGSPGFGNVNLPTAIAGAHLFPFWDDLFSSVAVDPASGVYYRLDGIAPNRIFTVEWYRDGHFVGVAGQHVTFQVRLFETTNRIQFKYFDTLFGGSQAAFDNGLGATVGVEGPLPAPRPFTLIGFNTASVTSGQCIEFVLPLACNPIPGANITVGNTAGLCAASGIVVPLPTFNPVGCADGVVTGLRYRVNGGPIINVPPPYAPPASITLNNLPVGVNTILWQTYIISNGAVSGSASQTVTVVDNQPPVITCPANINITLNGGECNAFVGYTVTRTDNCPFTVPVTITQNPPSLNPLQPLALNSSLSCSAPPTNYGRVFGGPTQPNLSITGLLVGINNNLGFSAPGLYTYNIYQLTSGTAPAAGNANMLLIGGPFPVAMPNAPGTYVPVTFPSPVNVPAGVYFFVEIIASTSFTMGNILSPDLPGTPSYFKSALCGFPNFVTFAAVGFPNNSLAFSVLGIQGGGGDIIQTAGLPSGSSFPIGTTTNCFIVADNAGNTATCCFTVTVNEFPNPITALACNDLVQVSLDENCSAIVTADMILEGGPYRCYDNYIVEIQIGGNWVPAILGPQHVGQVIVIRVTDPITGNSCWGTISVEDKIVPTIECTDYTLVCGQSLDPVFSPPIGGINACVQFPNLPVGPNGGTVTTSTCTVNLPGAAVINDVDVYLDIPHTWIGDLSIQIVSPSGVATVLWEQNCGNTDNLDLTFDDEGLDATTVFCNQVQMGQAFHVQPLAIFLGLPPLAQYDGQSPNGTWSLVVTDNVGGDGGTIEHWELIIDYVVNEPFAPVADDNCGGTDLTYTDTQSGDPCEGLIITRHWTVTDDSGNTATCDQILTIEPLDLSNVTCPPAFIGNCGDPTDPAHTGWPTVDGNPITDENNLCNIFVGYWDKPLNDCGNGEKIVRTWTILDWCTQTTLECVQVLKFSDNQAPVITCPANITVGTDFWYCYANVSVPKPTVVDACGSAWTLSLSASAGHIVNFGNNYVLNQLPLGTHTVTWRATDECGNSSTCSFTITVADDVVPVALCDAHTVVALTNDGPFGVTLVPASVFDDGSYDNCGPVTFRARRMDSCIDFDWTTEGACIDDTPGGVPPVNSRDRGTVSRPCVPFACCDVGAGPVMVELEVTDAAGNRNFCMVEAIVQDKISPFVECPPDITVSCDFWFNVEEGTFVDENGNNNGNLDEDPLSPIFGNMFDAFQYNDDESVRQDIIINDPGNNTISQPHFWGIDGWADDNCEVNLQVRVRVINDCSGDDLPPGGPAGAVKMVERRFSASDGNEGIAPGTCTQRIWVVDFNPFFITDQTCNNPNPNDGVIWPCDVLLTTCPEDLGDTGEPTVFDDACSLIGVAFEDTRFDFVDGACFKILRRWSVIDWCQYGSDGEGGFYGLWHYTQVIKVHDNIGPIFLTCPTGPVVLCVADDGVSLPDNNQAFLGEENPQASSCSVHLNLCQTVHETCSDFVNYDVKLFLNNGDEFIYVKTLTTTPVDENHDAALCFDTRQNTNQQIRNNGIPYNSPFCGDYHRILWSAEDGCGNWSHCEYLIRLEDCKQPSPVCINGLSTVVMPIGGQVTIWAKDFNASSFDDCTPAEDLLYSFSGTNYQPSFTYTCDNVPAFGVELSTQIWVADGGTDDNCNGQISWNERNVDFCTTTIVITDNGDACPGGGSVLIEGEILTEDVQSVEKVAVTLTSPGHVFPTYVTVEDGQYKFNNIIVPDNYTLNADRNDAHRNGVSTLDLVRIQKHLLGIEALISPYDLIAADANNSQSVSAIDLVELRKLILGIYTELPANKSWRFVDEAFQFADPTHPWPFDEVIDVVNMSASQYDKDFVAIKVGDVNNTVQANALQILPRNGRGVVSLIANDRIVNAGEMVDVAISSADFAGIEGYQFTMQTKGLEFHGVEKGVVSMSDENMGVFGSTLTASWHKVGGISATASDVLFTLQFRATAAGQLSTMMTLNSRETEAEAYNTLDDIKDLKLTFRGAEHGAEFALYQNEPNPFKGNTVIGYDLPAAGKVTLTLFDVTGKVLLVKDKDSVKGYNTIAVSSKDMPSVGVLYYRLDANEYTATKKMVIIE